MQGSLKRLLTKTTSYLVSWFQIIRNSEFSHTKIEVTRLSKNFTYGTLMPIDHRQNACIFDILTPKKKRIVLAFLYFFKAIQSGHHKLCNPGQDTLSKMAGCSIRTLYSFLQEKWLIKAENVKSVRRNRQQHCIYHFLDKDFFKTLQWLKEMGFTQNWKKHRLSVLDMLDSRHTEHVENRGDFLKSSPKFPTAVRENCRDIKSNIDMYTYQESVPKFKTEEEKKSHELLKSEGFSAKDCIVLARKYPFKVHFEARKDCDWYKKNKNVINLAALWTNRCKYHHLHTPVG